MNRTALIKIASQLDYDLSPKQKDSNGNYIKRLVPTDYRRTPNPSIGEVQYKPLPDYEESKQNFNKPKPSAGLSIPKVVSPTMAGPMLAGMGKSIGSGEKSKEGGDGKRFNPDYSGFNRLRRQGIITPDPIDGRRAMIYRGYNNETGMLNLDKARVRQLAGDNPSPRDQKLAEAIVRKSAERARQARYNLLSDEGKKSYDAVAKYYGHNPHYSTIFLPGSLSQSWGKQKVGFPNILYGSNGIGNPIAYDANANVPGYAPGDSGFVLDGYVYDKDGGINKTVLDDPHVKSVTNGNVMVKNTITDDPYPKSVTSSIAPHSSSRFFEVPTEEGYKGAFDVAEGLRLPGINVGNLVMPTDRKTMGLDDFGKLDPKDRKSKAWPSYNIDILDHEARHSMNTSNFLDKFVAEKDRMKKSVQEDNEDKTSNKYKRLAKQIARDLNRKKVSDSDPLLSDSYSGASNGFVRGKDGRSYVVEGKGEHHRAMSDLKGFVENYLKETLPPQMEARGELAGMTEDEQIDAISDRVVDMANNGKKFREILRNHNIIGNSGEGIPNWFIEDSVLGGTSRREAHRSINGFWKGTPSKEQLKNYVRPGRDQNQINNPGNRDYMPVYEKWIDEILPMIVNNRNASGTLS